MQWNGKIAGVNVESCLGGQPRRGAFQDFSGLREETAGRGSVEGVTSQAESRVMKYCVVRSNKEARGCLTCPVANSLSPEFNQSLAKLLCYKLCGRRLIPISGQQAGVVLIPEALVEKYDDPAIRFGAHDAPSRLHDSIHSRVEVGIFKPL